MTSRVWERFASWTSAYHLFAATVILSTLASGTELRGRVLNGTTRSPAAGDEVVLLSVSEDEMKEGASTTTDSAGGFSLPMDDAQRTHVLRVTHQGVTYHKPVNSGLNSIRITVYDAANQLDGIRAVMDVQRFEAAGEMLEVKQLVTMRNQSSPPRTLMSDRSFEVQLPVDAEVESGMVQVDNGQPLKQKPIRGEQKGHYYFSSPLRPGDTRFAIVYRLPYNGETLIEPKVRNAQERFVVMLPQAMRFEPIGVDVFHPMPGTTPDNVQGTAAVNSNQPLAFRISGTGMLAELEAGRRETQQNQAEKKTGPGGGLGPPIDAPDPLYHQRWLIVSGLMVILGCGVVYSRRRAVFIAAISQEILDMRAHRNAKGGGRKRRRKQSGSPVPTSGPTQNSSRF